MPAQPAPVTDIVAARVLAWLGDSVTTDHISPAGNIRASSPAGEYLQKREVAVADFNQYGARRGHHDVMIRGTFANIRIRNKMLPGVEGGVSWHLPSAPRTARGGWPTRARANPSKGLRPEPMRCDRGTKANKGNEDTEGREGFGILLSGSVFSAQMEGRIYSSCARLPARCGTRTAALRTRCPDAPKI